MTMLAAPEDVGQLRSLESEITDVRRYIRRHQAAADPDRLWMQLVWSDLLLEQWSAVDRRTRDFRSPESSEREVPGRRRMIRALPNAVEPLTRVGLGVCLQGAPDLLVVPDSVKPLPQVDVCVYATEQVDDEVIRLLRVSARRFDAPAVLVANRMGKADLDVLAGCRVLALLPRVAACSTRLTDTVRAVATEHRVPGPDLLTELRRFAGNS
ncbi:hypothetical protein [Amycolatopsis sp. NPDC051061]|uniref:hypothetical protein n=1 Tax=Amycolatopsis sp. NPDC051061 TaxID=3155042 RepID=UPI0034371992